MNWHGFGMYGWGGWNTDPGESGYSQRVKALGVNIHHSPYLSSQTNLLIATINALPPEDGVFVWGTSLGACNVPLVCNNVKRVDGAFGFQASIYGYHGLLSANIKFAHLIYSYNPIPFPGLGAYKWGVGTMAPASYHLTPHHIPHPGDYDVGDQNKFLAEKQRIMENTK
jgi:hypothetical protein